MDQAGRIPAPQQQRSEKKGMQNMDSKYWVETVSVSVLAETCVVVHTGDLQSRQSKQGQWHAMVAAVIVVIYDIGQCWPTVKNVGV